MQPDQTEPPKAVSLDMPLDIAEIARLEETRIATGVASVADEAHPVAGGKLCFAGAGSWANQALGLGMHGPVSDAELDELVDFYTSRSSEPTVNLCAYAHQSLVAGLARRQFVVREFETLLAYDLARQTPTPPPSALPISVIDPASPTDVAAYAEIKVTGFGCTDQVRDQEMERRIVAAPQCTSFLAWHDDVPVAAASVEMMPPMAALIGAATLAPYRGRGYQLALMYVRMQHAQAAGCRYVTVSSRPTVATGRNALRLGFQVAYMRVLLVRPGPNLVPVP